MAGGSAASVEGNDRNLTGVRVLTQVKTPRDTFFMPQRLVVPPFQRTYVWTQEGQWEPLWDDVRRLADKVVAREPHVSHFLGAIVLQQQQSEVGTLSTWTVIDGQQRLTTLQLLLDAIHEEVHQAGFPDVARQVSDLVENPEHFRNHHDDRFKVSPTNRDRDAFQEVMSAESPIDYAQLERTGNPRFAAAHEYFAVSVREWLSSDGDVYHRAHSLVQAMSHLLQIVVIDLLPTEDAQEIFETLNARGTPLTATDLIKNYVFQRLDGSPEEVEKAAATYWDRFETPFWETEVQAGPVTMARSSLFFNQWLVAQTGLEIPSKAVFSAFKRYAEDHDTPMDDLLPRIRTSADCYEDLVNEAAHPTSDLSRLALFTYRAGTLKSEAFRPIVIWLTDPALPSIAEPQVSRAVAAIESWLVRRACVRAGTKSYREMALRLLAELKDGARGHVGDVTERFLARQDTPDTYWPTDEEVRQSLRVLPIYKRFQRGRLRMLLEAVEDHRRGWDTARPKHEHRVRRGNLTIEHLMPQHWRGTWPPARNEDDRDVLVHVLGNLTLTTSALNTRVSNGPWHGTATDPGKYEVFSDSRYTAISLTQDAIKRGRKSWTDNMIRSRTDALIDDIVAIWPVPPDNTGLRVGPTTTEVYIGIPDLIAAGYLTAGQKLYARPSEYSGRHCSVTDDGWLKVGRERSWSPTGAARALGMGRVNGWQFWQTEPDGGERLSDLRDRYADERGQTAKAEESDNG